MEARKKICRCSALTLDIVAIYRINYYLAENVGFHKRLLCNFHNVILIDDSYSVKTVI